MLSANKAKYNFVTTMTDVLDLYVLDSEIESNSGEDPEVIAMTSDEFPEATVVASDDAVAPYVLPGMDTIDPKIQYIPVGTDTVDREIQYIPDPEVQYIPSEPSTSEPIQGNERSGASGIKGGAGMEESNGSEDGNQPCRLWAQQVIQFGLSQIVNKNRETNRPGKLIIQVI